MSKDALAKVVQRAISDAGFRRQLNSDPTGALRGFDLSADELSALRAGDAGRLSTLGIDQRMSKAYSLGGAVASTRMSQSDLTPGGGPSMVDDASGLSAKTVIPSDPTRPGGSADVDAGTGGGRTVRAGDDWKFTDRLAPDGSGTSTVRAGDDYKFAGRVAPEGGSAVRTGDDWKFADRAASQGAVAPVEGSPEATAADISKGGGMAAYPAHDGLAGPSQVTSARTGDDWKFADRAASQGAVAPVEGSPEASAADIAGATRASAIHDDPDGFLAANADAGGSVTRANVIHDDPDGFLAANADAGGSVTRANVIHDDPNGFLAANESYLTKVGDDATAAASGGSTVIHDDPDGFLAANADAGGAESPHSATDEGQITPS